MAKNWSKFRDGIHREILSNKASDLLAKLAGEPAERLQMKVNRGDNDYFFLPLGGPIFGDAGGFLHFRFR